MALATRNAAETLAREHARWLADEGKTLAALGAAGRGAGAARPAAPDRVLRHLERPGLRLGRQHGRLRGGPAADGRVPAVQDPDGRRRERLRVAPGGPAAPLPARAERRGGQCRGAPLGDARPRDHRRRQGPGRRGEGGPRRARASTTCRSRGSPRSARSCSCRAGRTRSCCRRRSSALYLVQRLRDEAHRFAITYHRDLRSKRQTHSAFDDLPGVGPKRRRALLRVFGSAKRVREAPVEQIAAVPGIGAALAARIKDALEAT